MRSLADTVREAVASLNPQIDQRLSVSTNYILSCEAVTRHSSS